MRSIHRSLPVVTLLPALAALTLAPGCVLSATRSSLGTDASGAEDVAGTESDVESLGTSLVSSDGKSVTTASIGGGSSLQPLDNTISASNGVGSWFPPAGCVQGTIDTTTKTATYVFNACTGPLGLVELDGTVNLTWADSPGSLTVNYSAQGFKINRATIDSWKATAAVTASGSDRHMVYTAQLSGTTARGRTFTRSNDKTIDWTVGQPCVKVSGQSDGTILGVELRTTIDAFSRCAAECPQAGSEITVENVRTGESIDIKYSGGPEAVLTINGKTSAIGLACGS